MKFFIAMCALSTLFFGEFTASGKSNIKTMIMKLRKIDVQPLADHKSVKYNESLVSCVEKCNRESSCNSLTYNRGTCSLYEKDYSEDDSQFESSVGSLYYSVYKNPIESATVLPSSTTRPQFHVQVFKEENSISWDEAQRNCENKGGNLVSILNQDIQNKVVEAMKEVGIKEGSWIGLKGMNKNDDFEWLEGTVLKGIEKGTKTENPFQFWHPLNPDNGDKDAPVRILGPKYNDDAYKWSDEVHKTTYHSYVCEFNRNN